MTFAITHSIYAGCLCTVGTAGRGLKVSPRGRHHELSRRSSSHAFHPGKVDAFFLVHHSAARTNNHHKLCGDRGILAARHPQTLRTCDPMWYTEVRAPFNPILSTAHPSMQSATTTDSPGTDAIPPTRQRPASSSCCSKRGSSGPDCCPAAYAGTCVTCAGLRPNEKHGQSTPPNPLPPLPATLPYTIP